MSASPAAVLEELKERRRHGDLNNGVLLEAVQGLPALSREVAALASSSGPEVLVRLLEIRALAERVFGEGDKAEAWLARSNASLSGQKAAGPSKGETRHGGDPGDAGTDRPRNFRLSPRHGVLADLELCRSFSGA
jgi:hypothetical protein